MQVRDVMALLWAVQLPAGTLALCPPARMLAERQQHTRISAPSPSLSKTMPKNSDKEKKLLPLKLNATFAMHCKEHSESSSSVGAQMGRGSEAGSQDHQQTWQARRLCSECPASRTGSRRGA